MSRSRSNSYDSDSARSDDSGYSSPAAPAPAPCPPLSATKINLCFKCGDEGEHRVDDGDGAAGIWTCRDCQFACCEHCIEAHQRGKAAVCGCIPVKSVCKKTKLSTPPETPTVYMDESE